MMRRRGWDSVIVRTIVFVPADHPQTSWVGVLPGLGDPHAAPFIKAEVKGLSNQGFSKKLLNQ